MTQTVCYYAMVFLFLQNLLMISLSHSTYIVTKHNHAIFVHVYPRIYHRYNQIVGGNYSIIYIFR